MFVPIVLSGKCEEAAEVFCQWRRLLLCCVPSVESAVHQGAADFAADIPNVSTSAQNNEMKPLCNKMLQILQQMSQMIYQQVPRTTKF